MNLSIAAVCLRLLLLRLVIGVRRSNIESLESVVRLCDAGIVQETCDLLTGEVGSSMITKEQLQTVLVSNEFSTNDLWTVMGFDLDETVDCASVCTGIVDVLAKFGECPPASDVGCSLDEDGFTRCDIDLSADALKAKTHLGGDLPDFHDRDLLEENRKEFPMMGREVDDPFIHYSLEEMVQRSANLFRIFPRALEVGAFDSEVVPSSHMEMNVTRFVSAGCLSTCYDKSHCSWPQCRSCEKCHRQKPKPPVKARPPKATVSNFGELEDDPEPWGPPSPPVLPIPQQTSAGRPASGRPSTAVVGRPSKAKCNSGCNEYLHCIQYPSSCSGCSFCNAEAPAPPPIVQQKPVEDRPVVSDPRKPVLGRPSNHQCNSGCTEFLHCISYPTQCSGCSFCNAAGPPPPVPPAPQRPAPPLPVQPPISHHPVVSKPVVVHPVEPVKPDLGPCDAGVCTDSSDCTHAIFKKFCRGCSFCQAPPEVKQPVVVVPVKCHPLQCKSSADCWLESWCSGCDFCRHPVVSKPVVTNPLPTAGYVHPPFANPGHVLGKPVHVAPAPPVVPPQKLTWKDEVRQTNLEAQAYVNTAIRNFNRGATSKLIVKWFGRTAESDPKLKQRVQKALNSVNNMLANVDYIFPGPQCKRNTYAYVYPKGPWARNDRGQFVFYLCDLYMSSLKSVQIETLTHEGSHHAVAYLDDVVFEGDKAYGRSTCERLASRNTALAVQNADSFCYYVQDVTDDAD